MVLDNQESDKDESELKRDSLNFVFEQLGVKVYHADKIRSTLNQIGFGDFDEAMNSYLPTISDKVKGLRIYLLQLSCNK